MRKANQKGKGREGRKENKNTMHGGNKLSWIFE